MADEQQPLEDPQPLKCSLVDSSTHLMLGLFDDKIMVIAAVTIICVCSMWVLGINAKEIVMSSITGLFGIAVGRATKG